MLPYKSIIEIDRQSNTPVYLQLCNQFVQLIQNGQLTGGIKLPSSRTLANICQLNRNTVTKAYQELAALGWVDILPKKGVFIANNFPIIQAQKWSANSKKKESTSSKNYTFYDFPYLQKPKAISSLIGFDDGLPDIRLAPIDELAKSYAKNIRQLHFDKKLSYTDATGNLFLKQQLSQLLNETRGLNTTPHHLLITRGATMAIHLAVSATIQEGDGVIVGARNYKTANWIIRHKGGQIHTIPVDNEGILVEAIPSLCQLQKIRAIYVTSHHHHPTTVTLSPKRRLRLMQLAQQYQFAILEDDYDYDFHYDNSPVLPLASGDTSGFVLHFGSFSKLIAPAFRVGYLVAPPELVQRLTKLRRIFDRQGDSVLEQTIGDLMANGTIRRHKKKSWRIYKARRDYCCDLLQQEVGDFLQFTKPIGGMAIWGEFDERIHLPTLSKKMIAQGIYLSNGITYQEEGYSKNGLRLGFASMNEVEMERAVSILKQQLSRNTEFIL